MLTDTRLRKSCEIFSKDQFCKTVVLISTHNDQKNSKKPDLHETQYWPRDRINGLDDQNYQLL